MLHVSARQCIGRDHSATVIRTFETHTVIYYYVHLSCAVCQQGEGRIKKSIESVGG